MNPSSVNFRFVALMTLASSFTLASARAKDWVYTNKQDRIPLAR